MKAIFLIIAICSTAAAFGQKLPAASFAELEKRQDSLRAMSYEIINGKTQEVRSTRNDAFIPALVKALKTPYSFYYPFDSLTTMAKVYPADSTFRIFTWPLENDNSTFRHFGVIQMNTKDGSLKLFPLFDNSDFTTNTDTITNHHGWYGCLYYAIIQRRYFNAEYYTLFGWDANNMRSQKKIAEMLTFKDSVPVFGGPYFSFVEDTVRKPTRNRFILEFKRDAAASLNWNPEANLIIYDHLISETGEETKKFTLVPDMDYEGFKWQAGKWVHVEKIFHDALEKGKVPVGVPFDKSKSNLKEPKTYDEIAEEEAAKQAEKEKGKKKKKN
ncbi:hypothetical protein [Chitinophaga caseinilytica]|uniref:hypothetical protein n=1 Tax=Chitinophaga caseinilytica TaxID=2267521 RepID=UPI003C2EE008